jgi:hypothetical protein
MVLEGSYCLMAIFCLVPFSIDELVYFWSFILFFLQGITGNVARLKE